jgi:hypothetical protein
VYFLHDNARHHTSQVAIAAATDGGFEILPLSPYSPNLVHFDSYLFLKLKTKLRVDVFEAMNVLWRWLISSLGTKIESFILKSLENKWAKCIDVEGDYI